jgi:hypothetical protein
MLEMPMQWGDNLGLFLENKTFALFQPNPAWNRILQDTEYDAAESLIQGVMDLRDNALYNGWEVSTVWAKKGYGPYLYLIGMTIAGPMGLMPSRIASQVSPAAKHVWWEFFQGQGKDLVTPIPLEATHHAEPFLNYKYVIKKPINIKKLIYAGQRIFANDRYGDKRVNFHEIIDSLLRSKMDDIYGDQ